MNKNTPRLGVTYLGNRVLRHAAKDLDEIAGTCDYVVHTVSETDIAYHKSVLSKILAYSHRKKLEIWADPWGVGGVFGGESFSNYLVQHRDSWQTMSDGRAVPQACLNRPELSHLLKEWILTVRDMGAEVIFWDEPHIHWDIDAELRGIFACACSRCAELFQKQYRQPLPKRLTLEVQAFRVQTFKNFLSELMKFAHSKGLRNALCVYAISGLPTYETLWEAAVELPDLDIFGCDPYWRFNAQSAPPQKKVGLFAQKTVESARNHNKASQIWIQAMKLASGQEQEIITAVREAARHGTDYLAAWSYDGGEVLDTVLSQNPEAVWKAVKKAYTQLRKGSLV